MVPDIQAVPALQVLQLNLHNFYFSSGVWAFLSCIPSAAVLHLHYLHRRQRIGDVHNENSLNWTIAFASVKIAVSVLGKLKLYEASADRTGHFMVT